LKNVKKTDSNFVNSAKVGAYGAAPFVELPAICQGQAAASGRPAAVIRKGGVSIEITESASPGFIAKILEAAAHAW